MPKRTSFDSRTNTWKMDDNGNWNPFSTETKSSGNDNSDNNNDTQDSSSPSDDSGLTSSNTNQSSSVGKTSQVTNTITLHSLEGSLSLLPTPENLKIKVGETISLKGFGKYLSGRYYVSSVNRTYSASGLSISVEVLKTNFRKSVKKVATKSVFEKKTKKG